MTEKKKAADDNSDAERRADADREEERAADREHVSAAQHLNADAPEGTARADYGAQSEIRPPMPVTPPMGLLPVGANIWDYGGGEAPDENTMRQHALERELKMARSRGVTDKDLDNYEQHTRWFLSNRTDDRVACFERDPRHPGGELFLASDAPDRGFLTETVQRLLLNGDIKVVPEPKRVVTVTDHEGNKVKVRNRRFPVETAPDAGIISAAQPGHATPIGRRLTPDLWDPDEIKQHDKEMLGMPKAIPVAPGGIVPKHEDVTRPA